MLCQVVAKIYNDMNSKQEMLKTELGAEFGAELGSVLSTVRPRALSVCPGQILEMVLKILYLKLEILYVGRSLLALQSVKYFKNKNGPIRSLPEHEIQLMIGGLM